MKTNLLHRNVNGFLAIFATIIVMMFGVCVIKSDVGVAHAADSVSTIQYNEINDEYIKTYTPAEFGIYRTTGNYTAPRLHASDNVSNYQDYMFAGWYTNAECTRPVKEDATTVSSNVYARFVDASLTSVKCQVIPGTTEESASTTLRLISTVDRTGYREVGFNVTFRGITKALTVPEIFKRFESNASGMECNYSPQALNQHANYFMAMNLINIQQEYFEEPFLIQTYWTTGDGTVVYGVERCVRVQDSYLRIVNVPVILNTDTQITNGSITLSYDTSRFTYWGYDFVDGKPAEEAAKAAGITVFDKVTRTTSTGKVHCTGSSTSATIADGMFVNIRLQLKEGALIESTTEFQVANEGFMNGTSSVTVPVSNVYYRNYSLAYSGGYDTSWYDEYATDTEFYISTPADLYGLAVIVNDTTGTYKNEFFEGDTIKLGANIKLNQGTASENGFAVTTGTKLYSWDAIGATSGSAFKGIFNGDGHTISGVYLNNSKIYQGLFGYCNGATIRDVRLENSYFENTISNKEALIGSFVGRAEGASFTMENVYCNAIMKSTSREVGGMIGYVCMSNASSPVSITSCWYAGDVSVVFKETASLGVGGFIGNSVKGAVAMDTCLFTGNIVTNYTGDESQASWGANVGGFVGNDSKDGEYISSVQIENSLSAGTIKLNWLKNFAEEKEIIHANQFIGYVKNSGSSAQNCYTVTAIEKYVENTGVTTDSSGYASGMFDAGLGDSNFKGIDYTFNKSVSDLYSFGARLWTDLPFVASDRADGKNIVWADMRSAIPVPAIFAENPLTGDVKRVYSLSGSGTSSSPYMINNVSDLAYFVRSSQKNAYAGKYVKLGANIVVNEGNAAEWNGDTTHLLVPWRYSVGQPENGKRFEGYFDGNNCTISGISMKTDEYNQKQFLGLFAATEVGSEVKNLRLKNSYFEQNGREAFTGSVAAECRGSLNNIYSDAIVTSITAQTGGIVARANGWDYTKNQSNTEARISGTISNCWYNGTISMTSTTLPDKVLAGDIGGIVGSLVQGEWTLTNCLFTGTLHTALTDTLSYAGGICGSVWATSPENVSIKETKLFVESCVSAGIINTSKENAGDGAGAIVGRMNAQVYIDENLNPDTIVQIATHLDMNNVFGTRDSGAQAVGNAVEAPGETELTKHLTAIPTVEGTTVWTTNSDRLIGFCKEDTASEYAGANLNFGTSNGAGSWMIRNEGTPVPITFSDLVKDGGLIGSDFGYSYKSFQTAAVHYGQGKYVIADDAQTIANYNSWKAYYTETAKFATLVETLDGDVYHTIFTRENGDYVVNMFYSSATKKLTRVFQTGIDEVLSPNLIESNVQSSGINTVTLGMVKLTGTMCDFTDSEVNTGYEEYYYGNSFVFKLPNDHFIINDGGAESDLAGLVQYLKKEAGIEESDMTTPIYVDAWTVSHQHNDHFGVVAGFLENKELTEQIRVEAFYINEPNNRAIDHVDTELSETLAKQYRGMQVLRTSKGERTPVYSPLTGQKYYFNGMTMNVVQSQEQIPVAGYAKKSAQDVDGTDYNTTSTNLIFQVNGGAQYKVFLTGDSNYVNMQYIMDTYGTNSTLMKSIDVYQLPHHGKNTSMSFAEVDNRFTDYLITGLNGEGYRLEEVLFPCSVYYDVDAPDKKHDTGGYPYAGVANRYITELNGNAGVRTARWTHYGDGTIHMTLGSSFSVRTYK